MPDPVIPSIALITGASRGIGAAVAVRLAREGAHPILVARNRKGLEQTDDTIRAEGGQATLVELDVKDSDKIYALARQVAERFGRLDALIGNAAVLGELSPLTHIEPKIWDEVMTVNVTANYHLLRAFDPLLQQSKTPQALFITSGITQGVFPYWGAYATSKAALETMVKTYAAEVKDSGIRAELFDPGIVRTAMRAKAFPGEDPEGLVTPEEVAEKVWERLLVK